MTRATADWPAQGPAPADDAAPGLGTAAVLVAGLPLAACLDGLPGADATSLPPAFERRQSATRDPGPLRKALAAADPRLPLPTASELMDWAQDAYAEYFPGSPPDAVQAPYVYRHYPATGNYLGLAGEDVYVLGPVSGGALLRVGSRADFATAVHTQIRRPDPADCAAARLLQQVQFAATDSDIAALRRAGPTAWLDQQLDAPRSITGVDWLNANGYTSPSKRKQHYTTDLPAQRMLWNQLFNAPDAARLRAALALSEFFVLSSVGFEALWKSHAIAAYWDQLVAQAFGNFRALLESVTLNVGMGLFLGTFNNAKEDGKGRQPDENYAREVMQLFTIGLYELNADGTLRLDAQGRPIETYGPDDVTGLARVFTGYIGPAADGPTVASDDPIFKTLPDPTVSSKPMRLNPSAHSTLEARFLGRTIAAGTDGTTALRIALDTLFKHPNVGPFFARQMIQRLVCSNPSPAYVARVAAVFADNGRGVRGDLRATFRALWLDPEAGGASAEPAGAIGKLREPMVRLLQWGRTFASADTRRPWLFDTWFENTSATLGQMPLRAPTVFNFFRPGHVPPGTALADRGWVAPEFQIVGESSVAAYMNFMQPVVREGLLVPLSDDFFDEGGKPQAVPTQRLPADYAAELPVAHLAPVLVRRLNLLLCAGRLPGAVQRLIIDTLNARPVAPDSAVADKLDRIAAAVLLVMASPEYLVEREGVAV